MPTRIVTGAAAVARALRAAAPLLAGSTAPVTARAPWLMTALTTGRRPPLLGARPVAVVVDRAAGPPAGLALLTVRRSGPVAVVRLLGQDVGPLPGGRPTGRLLAADDAVADELAAGVLSLLAGLRAPWRLSMTGLGLGEPTAGRIAAGLDTAQRATSRSSGLVDELDSVGSVLRSTDPAVLERWLPSVLPRLADGRQRRFLRAAARLHAGIGELETAVLAEGDQLRAVLLTLLDGPDRWPWWGSSDVGGLRLERGSPVATLTAAQGLRDSSVLR